MSDKSETGERIAKVMARAGIASRRDAEKMILAGRVAVNGVKAASPALDVMPGDKVTLDGKPIDAPQPVRLWLYYKPVGLVTSEKDEKGRQTVFDTMPEGMPRVMSVGRLDLTSEGLLLLTNDGELKRRLELPTTGWLRKYRVRVNGRPNDATFDPLRRGVTIEGEEFQPMEVTLDKQQGANAWLTVGLREGKNREIRRAMAEVGLTVNRLIRVSYGPFRLNTMKPGDITEVKARVLREQLGDGPKSRGEGEEERPKRAKPRSSGAAKAPRPGKDDRPRKDFGDRPARDGAPARKPRPLRSPAEGAEEAPRRYGKSGPAKSAARPPRVEGGERPARFGGAKPPRRERDEAPAKPRPYRERAEGSERPRGDWAKGDRKPRRESDETGDRPRRGPGGDGKSFEKRPRREVAGAEGRPERFGKGKPAPRRDRPEGEDRPRGTGFKGRPRSDDKTGESRPPRAGFGGKGKPAPRGAGGDSGPRPQHAGGGKGKPAPRREGAGGPPKGQRPPKGKGPKR